MGAMNPRVVAKRSVRLTLPWPSAKKEKKKEKKLKSTENVTALRERGGEDGLPAGCCIFS